MKLSVIIPTHNRADILRICLEKLLAPAHSGTGGQQGVEFEVIVVDDGSIDDTKRVVSNFQFSIFKSQTNHNSQISNLKYIHQPASHQAAARNRGVKEAAGDIIVFIGDDIFAEPDFLMKHHDRHIEHPEQNVVVLGYTTWDPALEITPYMKFLERSGWQFGYRFLKPGFIDRSDAFKFFYTSNISLKKSFFERETFNENFCFYGWEDIELGYRLQKHHDMKLFYEPGAIAYHHHFFDESGLKKKMRNVGKSAVHFQRLQPDVQILPRGLKAFVLKLASHKWTLPLFRIFGKQVYYKLKSWRELYIGLKES